MTNEEINVAIALERGYINPRYKDGFTLASLGEKVDGKGFWGLRGFPDYCNDLKAIHEAIKNSCSNSDSRPEFGRWLVKIILGYDFWIMPSKHQLLNPWELTRLATASPRQLCEAYLKTLKLWKE